MPIDNQPTVVAESLLVRTNCELVEMTQLLGVQEIVVAPDERRGSLPMEQMLLCAQRGIAVTDLAAFFEREAGMIKLNVVEPSTLVFSGGFDHSLVRRLSKRFFDLVAATALLLVAWPAMLVVALCVWLESGAPIFYRQVRVGQSGESFELVKFRSMRNDAREGWRRALGAQRRRPQHPRRPLHPQDPVTSCRSCSMSCAAT